MQKLSVQQPRDLVSELVKPSIHAHRLSREYSDETYVLSDDPELSEEEIDDFIVCNPLLDGETANQLTDPGLLGFLVSSAYAADKWLSEIQGEHNFLD